MDRGRRSSDGLLYGSGGEGTWALARACPEDMIAQWLVVPLPHAWLRQTVKHGKGERGGSRGSRMPVGMCWEKLNCLLLRGLVLSHTIAPHQ